MGSSLKYRVDAQLSKKHQATYQQLKGKHWIPAFDQKQSEGKDYVFMSSLDPQKDVRMKKYPKADALNVKNGSTNGSKKSRWGKVKFKSKHSSPTVPK